VLKALTQNNTTGRPCVWVGLSVCELTLLRGALLQSHLTLNGKDLGIDFDIIIFSGENEAEMTAAMEKGIGEDTKVELDPKMKQ
jgi:hypothetical protein